jgi:hypothetical protein
MFPHTTVPHVSITVNTIDVGITLRVTSIMLPPMAQPGAHEDHLPTKVGQYVGSEGSEEGFSADKAGIR